MTDYSRIKAEILAKSISSTIEAARRQADLTDLEVAAAVGAVVGTLARTNENLEQIMGYTQKHLAT